MPDPLRHRKPAHSAPAPPDPIDVASVLAPVFRRLRVDAGLRVVDVAQAAGVGVGTVKTWEEAVRVPKLPQLIALSGALGMRPSDVLRLAGL